MQPSLLRGRPALSAFATPAALLPRRRPSLSPTTMTHSGHFPPSHEGRTKPVEQPAVAPTVLTSAARRNAELRVRQHVNPLAAYFQRPVALEPGWLAAAFAQPELPLVVDVGVARGRWVKAMAERDGAGAEREGRNYLGLEIRAGLVAAANAVRDRDGLRNLHYLYCNANVSFGDIVAAADGRVALVCFQFCDPWFKARHAKRRLVQAPLVQQVYDCLAATRGQCYIVSDVRTLAEEMRDRFHECAGFVRDDALEWTADGWLAQNPFGMPTERETTVLKKDGGEVFRAMFRVK
jgi:tRNA (guanine-N7-)-methyltransferase